MLKELHKAVIPAGFIRRANTYTLIRNDDGIYVIYVGPAGRKVNTSAPLTKFVVDKVYSAIDKKVQAGEEHLRVHGPEKCVLEKNSSFIRHEDITHTAVSLDVYQCPKLIINTANKKYTFHCEASSMEEVKSFMHPLLD